MSKKIVFDKTRETPLTHVEANLYTNKAARDYLGKLSMMSFGARGKWKKLATELGLSINEIQKQMEAIANYRMEKLQDVRGKEVRSTEAEDAPSTADGVDGSGKGDDIRGGKVR